MDSIKRYSPISFSSIPAVSHGLTVYRANPKGASISSPGLYADLMIIDGISQKILSRSSPATSSTASQTPSPILLTEKFSQTSVK